MTYGIGFQVGFGWENGFIGNVDNFVIGNSEVTDTYDFEPQDTSNVAPVADDQSVTTAEDTAKDITLTASDVDSDPLTWAVVSPPAHGALTGEAPALIYTPALNYHGPDSFTFKVNDGTVDSNTATVAITVTPVNDASVADDQSVTTAEDTAKDITLTASDVESDPLTWAVVTPPTHGALSGTAPALTYTPALNYNGPDSFTFKVNDGTVDSNTATVTITVTPENIAPVADDQSITTAEDTAKAITLTATDFESDPLTWGVVTTPTHGALTGVAPALTYTPALNYHGPDSFTFKVNDGTVDSNTATVTITVTPENIAPVADDQSVTTAEDTAKAITLTATDFESDPLTWGVVTTPTHGALTGVAPALTYTPALNYHGPDSFTFKVNDGMADSNTATVTITVTPVNDAPVANDQSVTTAEDTAKAITLTASDVDSDPLTWAVVSPPAHGALSGTAPALTYTPALDYNGSDSFTFKVNDGTVDSNTATVTIAVNDAPVANAQSVTTAEDTAKAITLTASDVDGDPLTWTIVTPPAHGALTGVAPALTYTPAINYNGPDSFTFKVNDSLGDSNTATVTITVTPVNDAPVAHGQSVTTAEDTAKAITLTASDVDGDPLTWTIVTPPAHGALTGVAPALTYTPALNYHGPDSFTFKVNDGTVDSNIATVTISITPVNDPPVAVDDTYSTLQDTSLSVPEPGVLINDTDVEGDPMSAILDSGPSHGLLNLNQKGSFVYTPNPGFYGIDSFSYHDKSGNLTSNIATVTITVTSDDIPPVAHNQSVTTAEDTAKAITLTASDAESDPLTWTIVTPPTHGTLTGIAPSLNYTPALNYNGPDSFTFKANDGIFDSNTATVTITVTPVNDAPVANGQSVTTAEDTAKAITLTASDVDGDSLTWIIVTPPTHGTLSGVAPALTYTPVLNYNGPDSFTFKVNDGMADSNTATVTITVTPVNDAPVAVNNSYSTDEDTALIVDVPGVLGNDTDPENDSLTAILDVGPTHGALTLGADGSFTYTPDPNYFGTDSFTYHANDGELDSNIATVTITINLVEHLIYLPLIYHIP